MAVGDLGNEHTVLEALTVSKRRGKNIGVENLELPGIFVHVLLLPHTEEKYLDR